MLYRCLWKWPMHLLAWLRQSKCSPWDDDAMAPEGHFKQSDFDKGAVSQEAA